MREDLRRSIFSCEYQFSTSLFPSSLIISSSSSSLPTTSGLFCLKYIKDSRASLVFPLKHYYSSFQNHNLVLLRNEPSWSFREKKDTKEGNQGESKARNCGQSPWQEISNNKHQECSSIPAKTIEYKQMASEFWN